MQAASQSCNPGLIALSLWCERVGVAPVTAWRFRKRGWLKTVNIAGRVYVTDEAVKEFTRRAEAGDFAQEPKVPIKAPRGTKCEEEAPKPRLSRPAPAPPEEPNVSRGL